MVSSPPLETNKDEIGTPPMHNGIQKTSRNAHGQLEYIYYFTSCFKIHCNSMHFALQ